MTAGKIIALAVCAASLLVAVPWIIGNEFYVNMASQVLIYALFALSINMMLGYGGMVSLGHAAYLGIAGYACILLTIAGYDQLTAAILAVALSTAGRGVLRRAVAARAGARLHHDHAGARPDRLGRGVPGERAHRRRQRHPSSGAADAVRLRHPRRAELLLFHPGGVPDRAVFHLAVLALAVRREPDGHARPAAPHAHARPQSLAHPAADVRHGRLLGLGRQHSLRLLQPVPEPARDLAAAIRRDPADGDPRRRKLAHRPDRRRRDHHAGQERGLHLRRALEHAAWARSSWSSSCSCPTASCPAASSCGGGSSKAETAAPARHRSRPRWRARRAAGAATLWCARRRAAHDRPRARSHAVSTSASAACRRRRTSRST